MRSYGRYPSQFGDDLLRLVALFGIAVLLFMSKDIPQDGPVQRGRIMTNFVCYQFIGKPTEIFFPVSHALNKLPAETWRG